MAGVERRTVYLHLCLIILLPLAMLVLSDNWFFTRRGYLDPWLYLGFMLKYPVYISDWFQATYYGTRLSSILCGFFWHQLLPPVVANYAFHLTTYYLGTFSFYYVLAGFLDRPLALVATLLLGAHGWYGAAVGWDCTDGMGIALQLLSLAFLVKALRSERARLWLFLSGAAAGAMVHAHLFLFFFTPVFVIFFLILGKSERRMPYGRGLGTFILFFGLGAVALTALFGLINVLAGGMFLFFMPSIKFGASLASNPNPWYAAWSAWLHKAGWLVFPALAVVFASLFLLRRPREENRPTLHSFRVACALNVLYSAGMMLLWNLMGSPVLQLFYYASFLLPVSFLALSALALAPLAPRPDLRFWREAKFCAPMGLCAILLMLTGWMSISFTDGTLNALAIPSAWGWSLAAAALLVLLVRWAAPSTALTESLALLGLGLAGVASAPAWGAPKYPARETFEKAVYAHEWVAERSADRRPVFWYSAKDPFAFDFAAISSTYLWGYSLLTIETMPEVTAEQAQRLIATDRIVLMTSDPESVEEARDNLRSFGVRMYPRVTLELSYGEETFWLLMEDLEFGRPLALATSDLEFSAQDPHVELSVLDQGPAPQLPLQEPGDEDLGLSVKRKAGSEAIDVRIEGSKSAAVPLGRWVAPASGTYVLLVRYRVAAGRPGIYPLDEFGEPLKLLASPKSTRSGAIARQFEFNMEQGQRFSLAIENRERKSSLLDVTFLEVKGWVK